MSGRPMLKRAYAFKTSCYPAKKRAKTVQAKLSRLQRQVALLKPETKIFQSTGSFTNMTAGTYYVQYLSAIAQGSDKVNRIGNTIRPKGLHLKGALQDWVTSAQGDAYYMAIVLDRDSNGVVPTASGTAESIFTSANFYSALVQENTADRFKILWDNTATSYAMTNGLKGYPFIELRSALSSAMTFRDTSAAQTGAGKNALYLVLLPIASNSLVDFNFGWEITFTDV